MPSKRTTNIRLLIAAAAFGLVLYGGIGLWQRYAATHRPHPLPAYQTVTHSTTRPDETPINPASTYHVPADQPQSISLPSIHAEGFIQKVGLGQNRAVAVPTNVHMAGWYDRSVRPGDAGISLIDGHVQGYYQPGIFKNLAHLKVDDVFTVRFGNGSRRQFKVVSVRSYPAADAADYMLAKQPGITEQLNLITCGGPYDPAAHEYQNRVIVVSQRIG